MALAPTALGILSHPLGLPGTLTLASIPVVYGLGRLSGNVSWVDRAWTTWPLLCSALITLWTASKGGAYSAALPRMCLMLAIQVVWSIRLTWHTARRGLYELDGEDYRYRTMRKLVPEWFFELVHIFAVAIPQPLLVFSLVLPFSALLVPTSSYSGGPFPDLSLPWSFFSSSKGVPASTPVLHAGDALLALLNLSILAIQAMGDNQMYDYQNAKYAAMPADTDTSSNQVVVPDHYFPGFPTKGLFNLVRHPNFAGEQLHWLTQGLFAVCAVQASQRTGEWLKVALGPAFALSILFCGSTRLTEWITKRKYPEYGAYQKLVGMFLPQETLLLRLRAAVSGTTAALMRQLQPKGKGKQL